MLVEDFFKGKEEKILISHGCCSDGFGCAWALWNKYGEDIDYRFSTHKMTPIETEGKNLLFTDFAYSRKVMEELNSKNNLFVIDHHIDTFKDLIGFENSYFDLTKSASVLTWEKTFPGEKIPLILKYVQDRDLNLYNLEYSNEILMVLDTISKDFQSWSYFNNELENNFEEVLLEGMELKIIHDDKIKNLTKNPLVINIDGKIGLAVNAENWDNASYVAEDLSKVTQLNNIKIDFGMAWYKEEKTGNIRCSFRADQTRKDMTHVNKIAQKIGGGGHKFSAGAEISEEELFKVLKNKHEKKIICPRFR